MMEFPVACSMMLLKQAFWGDKNKWNERWEMFNLQKEKS